jgi:hypothetical protein
MSGAGIGTFWSKNVGILIQGAGVRRNRRKFNRYKGGNMYSSNEIGPLLFDALGIDKSLQVTEAVIRLKAENPVEVELKILPETAACFNDIIDNIKNKKKHYHLVEIGD